MLEHYSLTVCEDADNGLHLRRMPSESYETAVMRLWQVTIVTHGVDDKYPLTSTVFVLAESESAARSQAECNRPHVIQSRAIQIPFLIRGFGCLNA